MGESQVASWVRPCPRSHGVVSEPALGPGLSVHPRLCLHHRLLGRKAPHPPGHCHACPQGLLGADFPPWEQLFNCWAHGGPVHPPGHSCICPCPPSTYLTPKDPWAFRMRQRPLNPPATHPCSWLWRSACGLGCLRQWVQLSSAVPQTTQPGHSHRRIIRAAQAPLDVQLSASGQRSTLFIPHPDSRHPPASGQDPDCLPSTPMPADLRPGAAPS